MPGLFEKENIVEGRQKTNGNNNQQICFPLNLQNFLNGHDQLQFIELFFK
jgi:hypothetical protein